MTFPAGFLIVDKPSGVTSFRMVALVRRLTGVRRAGHAGTLDPLATGVLPVAVGQATRLIEYLDDDSKTYVADVRFGIETDTYDADGAITATADPSHVTAAAIEHAAASFVGEIHQRPPAFSAIKIAGQPAYRRARAGEAVEIAPRLVRIERLTLIAFEDATARIEVVCGKGTYIRSLAHDLGRALGCGAHLTALRRTASGGFTLNDAHSSDDLSSLAEEGRLEDALLAPDRAVERRHACILAAPRDADVRAGRDVLLATRPLAAPPPICRAYDLDGRFLGVLVARRGRSWHPAKVLLAG